MKKLHLPSLTRKLYCCILASLVLFASCDKNDDTPGGSGATGPDLTFYALTEDGRLLTLNAKNAAAVMAQVSISGLQPGESLSGIDFRPATGQLYGVGSSSRLYVIDPVTGAARAIGSAPFTPILSGALLGFDFNPTVDRIRLVTATGQNLRLHPETGAVAATDGSINGAANAAISSIAYTQNRAGATTTVLYDVDAVNNKLYKQNPPNDGKLEEVGNLGVDAEEGGGFDISPDGTTALAAFSVSGTPGLFTIDLNTGKATRIGTPGVRVTGLAIPTEPVAYAVSASNELLIFNPLNPAPVAKALTGIQTGENIVGIDFRPGNGQLYALGSFSRLYTVNASSGAAVTVGAAPFTTALAGTSFGFDFNPVVDRIRVVSNTGQNLRLNPVDGTVAAVDLSLAPNTAQVSAAAYINNFAGATATTLFDIDAQAGILYKQDPPNNGTLTAVGPLGITGIADAAFDIGGTSGTAYALLTVNGTTKIYTVNLQTGVAVAGVTFPQAVRGFTVGLGF